MSHVGIIILNWNDYKSTIKLIDSILEVEQNQERFSIYIVDNGSIDESINKFKNYIKHKKDHNVSNLILVSTGSNMGYAKGNNEGIKKAISNGCEYVFILNNDVLVKEPLIDKMVDYYVTNEDVGVVTLKILNQDYSLQKWCARKDTKIVHRLVIYSPLSRWLRWTRTYNNYFHNIEKESKPIEIELFSGAAFLISAFYIEQVGFFDENTFLYEEESILAHKLRNQKKKIIILPNLYIIHQDGQSTQKLGLNKYKYMMESEKYYIENYSTEKFLYFKKNFLFLFRNIIWFIKKLEGKLQKRVSQ